MSDTITRSDADRAFQIKLWVGPILDRDGEEVSESEPAMRACHVVRDGSSVHELHDVGSTDVEQLGSLGRGEHGGGRHHRHLVSGAQLSDDAL